MGVLEIGEIFLRSAFGEEVGTSLLIFIVVYCLVGLIALTFRYSILGDKKQEKLWRKTDFLSKII